MVGKIIRNINNNQEFLQQAINDVVLTAVLVESNKRINTIGLLEN